MGQLIGRLRLLSSDASPIISFSRLIWLLGGGGCVDRRAFCLYLAKVMCVCWGFPGGREEQWRRQGLVQDTRVCCGASVPCIPGHRGRLSAYSRGCSSDCLAGAGVYAMLSIFFF